MDFLSVLSTAVDAIEKPAALPMGTYLWKVTKEPRQSQSKNGDFNIIEIPVAPVQVHGDDVDLDQLEAYGDVAQGANNVRFMFPTDPAKKVDVERALFNLKKFALDTLQMEAEGGATVKELLAKMPGHEFVARAAHRNVDDTTYVDLKDMGPVNA